jgi:hypothetical protein
MARTINPVMAAPVTLLVMELAITGGFGLTTMVVANIGREVDVQNRTNQSKGYLTGSSWPAIICPKEEQYNDSLFSVMAGLPHAVRLQTHNVFDATARAPSAAQRATSGPAFRTKLGLHGLWLARSQSRSIQAPPD